MNNSFDKLPSILVTKGYRINKFKDKLIEIIQTETRRVKNKC